MKKIGICFIGCGNHANRFVYPALSGLPDAALLAVCSLDPEEAETNRRRHGAAHAYTDYREMIRRERPEAVIVVGPPQLHFEAGTFCIECGIPFYTEKPSGADVRQARELAERAEAAGVYGQVGFMMRHSAVIREAGRLMAEHRTGAPEYGIVRYFTSGPYRSDEIYGMPGTDDLSFLRRYLAVQAVHPVNLAASFLGDIAEVTSEVRFSGENILTEIRLKDAAGKRMNALLHTFVAPEYGNLKFGTELFFADRSMIFINAFASLDYYPPAPSPHGNSHHWEFAAFGNSNIKMGYETELRYFLDCVRGNEPREGLATLRDSLKTMEILETVANEQEKREHDSQNSDIQRAG